MSEREARMGGERELTGRVVLVCGGRDYSNYFVVKDTLAALRPQAVVHGGAPGADAMAGRWARMNGIPEIAVPANWNHFGKAAGPARNGWMLDFTKADLVVAFPGGAGTANMVRQARERGVQVFHPDLSPAPAQEETR